MPPTLDPNTNTREEFTTAALQQPVPADAAPQWKDLNTILKVIAHKLIEHDAMRENKLQPFMTPAAKKSRVYFLWDSITRLLATLYELPPQLEASPHWCAPFKETWEVDCVAKSKYVASLMVDGPTSDPISTMLTQAMAQGGEVVALGSELTALGQRLSTL